MSKSFETQSLVQTICPICKHDNDFPLFHGNDPYLDLRTRFQVVKCCNCGLVRLKEVLDKKSMDLLYQIHYGGYDEHTSTTAATRKHNFLVDSIKSFFQINYQIFAANQLPTSGNFLEVGCGTGDIMAKLREKGVEITGIEQNTESCSSAQSKGLTVICSSFENYICKTQKYDHILFSYTLEHFLDPLKTLSKAADLLSPTGTIHIFTPNYQSIARYIFNNYWMEWHIPYNKFIFDHRTLDKSAQKCGLVKVRSRTLTRTDGILESLRIIKNRALHREIGYPTANKLGLITLNLCFRPFNILGKGNLLYAIYTKP